MQIFTTIALLALSTTSVFAVGRNPTGIEHNACKVQYSTQVKAVKEAYKDNHVYVEAFNVSLAHNSKLINLNILILIIIERVRRTTLYDFM